jgi:hypothetical protein
MKQQLLNEPEDCQWLKETHLKNKNYPEFKSFVLYGNEDAPEKLELYFNFEPEITDVPAVVIFD